MKSFNYPYSLIEEIKENERVIYKVNDSIYDTICYCEFFKEIEIKEWDLSLKIEDELRELKNNKEIFSYFNNDENNLKRYYKVFENYPGKRSNLNKTEDYIDNKELNSVKSLEKEDFIDKDDDKYTFYLSYLSDLIEKTTIIKNENPEKEIWFSLLKNMVSLFDLFKKFNIDKSIFLELEDCYYDFVNLLDDVIEETNNHFINEDKDLTPIRDYYFNKYKEYRRENPKDFLSKDISLSLEEMAKEDVVVIVSYINRIKDIINSLDNHKDIYLWHDLYDEIIIFFNLFKNLETDKVKLIEDKYFVVTDMIEYITDSSKDFEEFKKYEEFLMEIEETLDDMFEEGFDYFVEDFMRHDKRNNIDKKKKSTDIFYTFIIVIIIIVIISFLER